MIWRLAKDNHVSKFLPNGRLKRNDLKRPKISQYCHKLRFTKVNDKMKKSRNGT